MINKNDLMLLTIINYDIEAINDDSLASFNMMLQNDNFSDYHQAIKDKIAEYEKALNEDKIARTCKVSKFKIGSYYKTLNGSVICISNEGKDATGNDMYNCIVIKGGFTPNEKESYQLSFGGNIRGELVWSNFYINTNVKYQLRENDESFAMHIVCELKVSYEEIGAEKMALDNTNPTV